MVYLLADDNFVIYISCTGKRSLQNIKNFLNMRQYTWTLQMDQIHLTYNPKL